MSRYAIMVDAGYLLHKGAEIVSAKASTDRGDLQIIDPQGLIALLIQQSKFAFGDTGRELLRVYWYDGVMAGGLTPQQRSMCELPDVNFRAGLVNSRGQQKGVDSLIVTDLFELASNRAVMDAVLVTGDSDLAIGIELAQKKGVRIAVLGLEDHTVGVASGQSREITDRADRVQRFGGAELRAVLSYVPRRGASSAPTGSVATTTLTRAPTAAPAATPDAAAIDNAVRKFCAAKTYPKTIVDASTKRIDGVVDRALIHFVFTELGNRKLSTPEKIYARQSFRTALGLK